MKPLFVILMFAVIFCIYGCANLQPKMNDVIKEDPRNDGIQVSVHFKNFIDSSVVIYNLKSVSGTKSMADVFRVFLQFAEKTQTMEIHIVELQFRGKTKFIIDGKYFQTLGKEYSWQNPLYTMRTFPENLLNPDGSRAYPEWSGGWLGVMEKQIEDFNDFQKKWWVEDMTNNM